MQLGDHHNVGAEAIILALMFHHHMRTMLAEEPGKPDAFDRARIAKEEPACFVLVPQFRDPSL